MNEPSTADRLIQQLRWEDLDPAAVTTLIRLARKEDLEGWGLAKPVLQSGDVTSQALRMGHETAEASLVSREKLVICGLPLVPMVLQAYGDGFHFAPACPDGTLCPAGTILGTITGPARLILEAERVLLNFLQKLSGVATTTRSYVDQLMNSKSRLLDTRKTTPGYRVLEKYAVACGGGYNHRIGLFDRVMLKDNHLAAEKAQSGFALSECVSSTRKQWPGLVIELEVDRLEQIHPVLDSGVDVFLLDNFTLEDLTRAVSIIGDKAATEASGGITLDNLSEIALTGVDFISTGATIHQSTWKDIGLDWKDA